MAKQTKKKSTISKRPPAKAPKGRPTLFKQEYIEQAYLLCKQGLTDKQIAEFFNIAESTLNDWKRAHKDFLESITRGKDEFDTSNVENALLKRAIGYEYDEDFVERQSNGVTKVRKLKKKMPPDVLAQMFWLKNRNSKRWKDKQEIEHSGEIKSGVLMVPAGVDKNEWLKKAQSKTPQPV